MTVETMQVPRANPRPPGAEDMVARRVAYERKKRGWSTAELARRMTEEGVPVNQSSIYKIESGEPRRTISLDEAHAFARVFGLRGGIDELESIPDELIGAELAAYVDELEEIQRATDELQLRILRLLERAAGTAEDIGPLFDYMESDPPWQLIRDVEDRVTRLADLIIKVRDSFGKLRLTRGTS